MRTTVFDAATPRSYNWQSALSISSYTPRRFPPVDWQRVPSDALGVKWCEGIYLTWVSSCAGDKGS